MAAGKSAKPKAIEKRPRRRPASGAYQIVKPEQLEAVVSTRRMHIIHELTGSGTMSVRELARSIGVAPSSLYYHIEELRAVGLLVEAGVRQISNKPEQLYALAAQRLRLFDALQEPGNWEVLKAVAASMCRQAKKDFSDGFKAAHKKTSGTGRNIRFGRLVGRPDAATLKRINAHLDAVTELVSASASEAGERVAFTWVMAPQATKKART